MKYNSILIEATLLKRSVKFLAEVILSNGQKLMIRCPNLNPLVGCDILGTKLWYSRAVGYHCLPTWELVEVEGGNLVCINSELVKSIVIESINKGRIEALCGYQVVNSSNSSEQTNQQILLLEAGTKKCYLCLEQVTLGNEQGEGFFPEKQGMGINNLNKLIELCRNGYNAVLFFCVTRTGIDNIKPAYHIDPKYGQLLEIAVKAGVKLIAYKTATSLQGIELAAQLPILFSEDAVSREY